MLSKNYSITSLLISLNRQDDAVSSSSYCLSIFCKILWDLLREICLSIVQLWLFFKQRVTLYDLLLAYSLSPRRSITLVCFVRRCDFIILLPIQRLWYILIVNVFILSAIILLIWVHCLLQIQFCLVFWTLLWISEFKTDSRL